jgi:hypothetical protein
MLRCRRTEARNATVGSLVPGPIAAAVGYRFLDRKVWPR